MTLPRRSKRLAWLLIAPVALSSVALVGPAASAADTRTGDVVDALERAAHPLRSTEPTGGYADLRPFGRMVRGADVVGVGEATHSSREFFTMKHRLFRYLVKEQGFDTFVLETGWSTGVRINEYVQHGKGDIRRLMREEYQGLAPWQNEEFVDLFQWMRTYNERHPDAELRFAGDDLNSPKLGKELTGTVIDHVRRDHPELVPAFRELYREFRAAPEGNAYLELPLAKRQAIADQTDEALRMFRALNDGTDEFTWTAQHARSIAQTAAFWGFDVEDPDQLPNAMRYRDRVMAANTAWLTERAGAKVLMSAHNGHVSYVSDMPQQYPKTQGAFLRERLGSRYVTVGHSFDSGSFNAVDKDGYWTKTYTVDPAPEKFNEHTLDEVRYRDYLLDTRTAPPAARDWLAEPRLTRSIGTAYPWPPSKIALGESYDIVIHLHRVHRSQLLP